MSKKTLIWGQTPFDSLTHEELLRLVQAMYSALVASRSAMKMAAGPEPDLFWGMSGSGGRASLKCKTVLDPIHAKFEEESIYRSFFRYADDLLFPSRPSGDPKWLVCEQCNQMVKPLSGTVTECFNCKSPVRELNWSDLDPALCKSQPAD